MSARKETSKLQTPDRSRYHLRTDSSSRRQDRRLSLCAWGCMIFGPHTVSKLLDKGKEDRDPNTIDLQLKNNTVELSYFNGIIEKQL